MSSNLSFNKLKNSKLQAAAFEYLINFDKTKYLLSNSLDDHSFFHTHLIESKKAFEGARPPPIFKQNFKIWNVFTNFFNQAPAEVDESLAAHSFTEHLIENYTEILEPGFLEYLSFEEQCANNLYYLRLCQWMQILKLLTDFRKNFSENHHCEMTHFPAWLQNSLKEMAATKGANRNLKVLFEQSGDALCLIDQLLRVVSSQVTNYIQLIQVKEDKERRTLIASIQSNDKVVGFLANHHAVSDSKSTYNTSIERVFETLPKDKGLLDQPMTITMVGVEYAGLWQEGGLAEALEGLSRGFLQFNSENRVKLIFPKYSQLPKDVLNNMGDPEIHRNSQGKEYRVYTQKINGVECYFIEHPSFKINSKKPTIYDSKHHQRFAIFSSLAADLICDQKDSDLIHLHDWHVAGVALKFKKDHPDDWSQGRIPPVLFTYHNNSRGAQGRISQGPYSYAPSVKSYVEQGVLEQDDNLFIRTLDEVDGVTTVSRSFAVESQQIDYGEGVSFAVKRAAKVGNLAGIVNGINAKRWNPEKDPTLLNWKEIGTGEIVDLSYGPHHPDLWGQRTKCRKELEKWVESYFPDAKIDFSKPLVTYIGRFDSGQKGLDKFEECIKATLKNGGQFICMGSLEDPEAKRLLDSLKKKYKEGVLFIRDFKEGGKFYYQQGDGERQGIGSVVRAASDFLFIPSRFEPCGLVQLEGWLFGSLAIGSRTGGLADTIVSQDVDQARFNGFLFNRDKKDDLTEVITHALQIWNRLDDKNKVEIIKRIIEQGREDYAWTSTPQGEPSSVHQYRACYELTRLRAKDRQKEDRAYPLIESLRHKNHSPLKDGSFFKLISSPKNDKQKEAAYLKTFYTKKLDRETLDKLYSEVPREIRSQVPAPYGKGVDYLQHETYGAFLTEQGSRFAFSSPEAKSVSVILFNDDKSIGGEFPMERRSDGRWEIVIPHVEEGQKYRYKIDGKIKIDPYGRFQQHSDNPQEAPFSVISSDKFSWSDEKWLTNRFERVGKAEPMSIYEIHLTSWKKDQEGKPLNYRHLAQELVAHCQKVGYTHIELVGAMEHALEESWGYQVTGFFAPNSRLGSIEDFKTMVDYLHEHNIGVILDWVPAHFSKNDYVFEERYGAHGLKHTFGIRNAFYDYGHHFDYTKKEVREFLISNAYYWLKEMHIDGLRVDCISSILYSEDREAAELFLRDFNAILHNKCPGTISIAEDFSGDNRISTPFYDNGFNFDFKWHVGWTRLILEYFSSPLKSRQGNFEKIQNAIMSDNFHRQIVCFSHDDVKHEFGTLFKQMEKIDSSMRHANLRAQMSLMFCSPGKKLNFVGNDAIHEKAWDNYVGKKIGLQDDLDMDQIENQNLSTMLTELHHLYKRTKPLYKWDANGLDIEWIADPAKRVHAYRRQSSDGSSVACVHNFTGQEQQFTIAIPKKQWLRIQPNEIFNSDALEFGGKGWKNPQIILEENDEEIKYTLHLAPLSTAIIDEGQMDMESQIEEVIKEESLLTRIRNFERRLLTDGQIAGDQMKLAD
ncbi:MAG: glycogen/starch synthase [Rhabdochlamydiaceae bacterium]|jgi:1,4-alpha-glucan branching enzyme